jgi:hypothetical protein
MEMNWNDSLADFVPDEDVHSESEHDRQTTPRGPHPSRPTLPSPRWDERLGGLR